MPRVKFKSVIAQEGEMADGQPQTSLMKSMK